MGSFLKEGMSSVRPPLFDGTDYDYWSSRMKFHVQAIDFMLWRIISDGDLIPMRNKVTRPGDTDADGKLVATGAVTMVPVEDIYTVDLSEVPKAELDKISLNSKAINLLHQSLCSEEYGRIKGCSTAKEIWDCLQATHVGTNQVKDTKIRILTSEYESFKMKTDETISAMHQRLNLIVNNLDALGKTFSRKELNGKILASLTKEYRPKRVAVTESKDLSILPQEELIGSLLAYEAELAAEKAQDEETAKEKKSSLALNAMKNSRKSRVESDSDEELDDEQIALVVRKFRKYLKFPNQGGRDYSNKSGHKRRDIDESKDSQLRCFECDKSGHVRANCPKLKSRYPSKNVVGATWDSYCSGDESSEDEGPKAVCLMANNEHERKSFWDDYDLGDEEEDEVACTADTTEVITSNLNSSTVIEHNDLSEDECTGDDLSEAFGELYKEYEMLSGKNKVLTKSNKSLQAQVESLVQEVSKLKDELAKPKPVNLEVLELKQDFAKLKVENENLKECIGKFEAGEKTLSKILYSQQKCVDKRGIGFEGPSTSSGPPAKTVFVAATSTRTPPVKKPVFSCTYCQKGNHGTFRCPIRRLCELGTLIPAWKKPRWIVKRNPLETNPHGPNKTWVPGSSSH